jgi:hypothetical protein
MLFNSFVVTSQSIQFASYYAKNVNEWITKRRHRWSRTEINQSRYTEQINQQTRSSWKIDWPINKWTRELFVTSNLAFDRDRWIELWRCQQAEWRPIGKGNTIIGKRCRSSYRVSRSLDINPRTNRTEKASCLDVCIPLFLSSNLGQGERWQNAFVKSERAINSIQIRSEVLVRKVTCCSDHKRSSRSQHNSERVARNVFVCFFTACSSCPGKRVD